MIKVEQLQYAYPQTDFLAVNQVSFEIKKGEIFGFLGPSGAGKSTTQKVLIRLLKGYEGRVEVLGKMLSQWDESYYNHIGVGFELPNHYLKLTALENLDFFASFYDRPKRDAMELLAQVGLEDAAKKRVSEFSKGMKMRLNFVRALLHNPDILFFDEPTSGLDPGNARILKQIILDLKKDGKTIFITTHSMQDAEELCDRVAFIVDGKIASIESPRELKLQYGKRMVRVEYLENTLHQREFELDGLGQNAEFLQLLQQKDIQTIHTEEASLEDVFIQITGKQLSNS
jgi:fluoroquinolone transport system ATP-binding protein